MNFKKREKYLIIALLAVALSACGGSGGSGGNNNNSNTGNNGVPNNNVIIRNDSHDNQSLIISGKTVEVKGEIEGWVSSFTGISAANASINNRAEINVEGKNSIGILSDSSTVKNYGEIDVEGSNSTGILGKNNSRIYNYNKIEISDNTTGIEVQSNSTVINNSIIQYDIENDYIIPINSYSVGIRLTNSTGENHGKIILISGNNTIKLDGACIGENSTFVNKKSGMITVSTNQAGAGMRVIGKNAIGKNEGIINVSGTGTYGMLASNGGTIINESTGIINVSSTAAGAMYVGAGSKGINYGTINIDHLNPNNNILISDKNGTSLPISAMNTSGGTIENYGNINTIGSVTIKGTYGIGTTRKGAYGKLSGDNILLDSEIVVTNDITKGSYKDEYYLDGVVKSNKIMLGKNYQLTISSLLYTAEHILDENKMTIKVSKSGSNLSDFVDGNKKETAQILDKYYTTSYYNNLNKDGKLVIDSINISNKSSLGDNIADLTPTIYSTIPKQLLDIDRVFNEFEKLNVDVLENSLEHEYIFNLITEYQDISDKNDIEGYDSTLIGFLGTKKFDNGIYGSLGYGHTELDYDSNKDSKINTIFAGIHKRFNINSTNIDLGLNSEYNFHETERKVDFLDRNLKSKYDSYMIKLDLEISKRYGDKYYFIPYTGISTGIGKYEDIKEKNGSSINAKLKGETFSTLTPKVGGKIGMKNESIHLYASAKYLYEMGNVNKDQNFSLDGFNGSGKLPTYDTEGGKGTIAIGIEYKKGGLVLDASTGKRYESKDDSETFIKASIGYKF